MEKKVYEKLVGSYYYTIINHTFSSLYEYVNYLKDAKSTPNFSGKESSFEVSEEQTSWTGTKNFNEALALCVNGEYDASFDEFDRERMSLEKELGVMRRNGRVERDIIGFAPNVPAYLIGVPKNMYNVSHSPKQAPKIIDVYYNISALSRNSLSQMRNRGICTLTLIKDLESQGYSVNLHLFAATTRDRQVMYTEWNLKNAGEDIDYRSIYFPMVNPSFLRRLHFRLRETTPELSREWVDGYGYTCSMEEISKFVNLTDKGIVINQPTDHDICGNDIVRDYLNFTKSVSSQLEKFTQKENSEEREM